MSDPQVVAVIPSRYGSTRLPGKPLVMLAGKAMVQHVYERAKRAQTVHQVVVATDDQRIVDAVKGFGGQARMTRSDHRTGTERYFSRAPIPWVRDTQQKIRVKYWKHLGLYAFRREALLEYATLPQGELERIEQLEQLRWLENGWKIRVAEVAHDAVSVDVPEDVARVEKLLHVEG
jgi:CMP-2-keto-3-deoxyoctulosonic acid synthetase